MSLAGRPAEVLLVEDNEDDVVLVRLALARCSPAVHLSTVANGAECLRLLRREAPFFDAARPDLILLDINMPVLDGHGTLAALDADPSLRCIPVVVLTTSAREEDVIRSYRARCAGYIVKPMDVERFFEVIAALCAYWLGAVQLPARAP